MKWKCESTEKEMKKNQQMKAKEDETQNKMKERERERERLTIDCEFIDHMNATIFIHIASSMFYFGFLTMQGR